MPYTTVVAPCFDGAARLPVANPEALSDVWPAVDFPLVKNRSTDEGEELLQRLEERDFVPAVGDLARIYRLYR